MVSHSVICFRRKSRFINPNYAQPDNCVIFGKNCILFVLIKFQMTSLIMNEIVSNSLLPWCNFMSEMYLKEQGFTYRACWPFTETKERLQDSEKIWYSKYIYKKELGNRPTLCIRWLIEIL